MSEAQQVGLLVQGGAQFICRAPSVDEGVGRSACTICFRAGATGATHARMHVVASGSLCFLSYLAQNGVFACLSVVLRRRAAIGCGAPASEPAYLPPPPSPPDLVVIVALRRHSAQWLKLSHRRHRKSDCLQRRPAHVSHIVGAEFCR